jgi:predicted membrane-bound mannosyltransferase
VRVEGDVIRSAADNALESQLSWQRSIRLLLPVLVVAIVVRLYGIELRPMFDEADSWTFARLPWSNFWRVMWDYEGNMVFYYLLLKAWLVFGDSELVVRGLSAFIGVAYIPALYLLGRRLFGAKVAFLAASLLAVHSFHVAFSQQARS